MAEADLSHAELERAVLSGADLTQADLSDAKLREADLAGAKLRGATLQGADLRRAILEDAELDEAVLTGAKVHGVERRTALPDSAVIEWADGGSDGAGKHLVDTRQVRRLFVSEPAVAASGAQQRFFGQGDVLRNAQLEFEAGAAVQVESRLQSCSIRLGPDAELVLGEHGVMEDCTIIGGRLTIHGQFRQGEQPGLVNPRRLVVSKSGIVASTLQQPPDPTEFGFERGCRLRLQIKQPMPQNEEPRA